MRNFITTTKGKIFAIIFWICVWQLVSSIINETLFLPSPIETVLALIELTKTSSFYLSVIYTFLRVMVSLGFSIVLGITFGILSTANKYANLFIEPLVSTVKSIPVMSFILLAILYLNSDYVPILVCVMLCFPIIYTNTQKGILSIDKKLIELATLHKVSKFKILTHIKLPAIIPFLLSSILISIGFSWKAVVTAEVLSIPKHSIGHNLYDSKLYLNTQDLFAWTLVIVILSILIEKTANYIYHNSRWYINGASHDKV
jgi:NitT/TauT family transport system permease protein